MLLPWEDAVIHEVVCFLMYSSTSRMLLKQLIVGLVLHLFNMFNDVYCYDFTVTVQLTVWDTNFLLYAMM